MSEEEKPKRNSPLSIRLPPAFEPAFHRRVSESGLSRNAYVVETLIATTRFRPDEQRLLAQILGQEARQTDAIKSISNSLGHITPFLIEQAAKRQTLAILHETIAIIPQINTGIDLQNQYKLEIRALLMTSMGRKP